MSTTEPVRPPPPSRRPVPRTAVLLAAGLGSVVLLTAAMLALTLAALDRVVDAEAHVASLDRAKHAAHIVEAQVREQYIHQAHMMIDGTLDHLPHYDETVRDTRTAIAHLRAEAVAPNDRHIVTTLTRLAEENDRFFRDRIVPALRAGHRDRIPALHAAVEPLLARVTRVNAALSASLNRRAARARADARDLSRRTRLMATFCFALAVIMAAVVAVVLIRRILRRLAAVRRGALRLAAGDLDARIGLRGRDEFAELGATFDAMAARLADHQRRLVRSERLAVVGQVAAGVAHEINNPLGVILGYVRLLQREQQDPRTREVTGIIEEETRQCQRIVAGLLDLSRGARATLTPVDLLALARDVAERLAEVGRLAGARVEVAPGEVTVAGDGERLRQVLTNLLVNAAEAAGEGGRVRVTAERVGGDVVLAVEDDGPGFDDEALARACEPFFTTRASGVGLGLAICQSIVEAHGGRIEIGRAPGGGARVAVRLPREHVPEGESSV